MNRAIAAVGATAAGFAAVVGLHTVSSGSVNTLLKTAAGSGGAAGGTGRSASSGSRSSSGPAAGATTPTTAGPASGATGTAVGAAEQYGYGILSVKVTVSGGKITDVSLANLRVAESYSQMLAQQVVPMLRQEVLAASSARVNGVSGATYTSEAYLMSVQSALDKLHA